MKISRFLWFYCYTLSAFNLSSFLYHVFLLCQASCLSVCPSVFLSVCLSVRLSVGLCVCLYVRPSFGLCVRPSVSVCLSLFLSFPLFPDISPFLSQSMSVTLYSSISLCFSLLLEILSPYVFVPSITRVFLLGELFSAARVSCHCVPGPRRELKSASTAVITFRIL